MCSEFILFTQAAHIKNNFGIENENLQEELNFRVRGYMKIEEAPVIFANANGKLEVKFMKFSLCPVWSKEFPCKFSTYNARMERPKAKGGKPGETEKIYEVPTWKVPFISGQTCLIPMNAAIESSYFGKSAGHIIRFKQANEKFYYCAGLWSQYIDKSTGEIHDTFTLITDDPYKFFLEHGHDRSVFVLDPKAQENWLLDKKQKPEERFKYLRSNRTTLDWAVDIDRKMKEGWQKRAPTSEEIEEISKIIF